ncbi:MAG: ferrous iron transport protein B [Gammaproteobacteria bacterium RIFCSPHIGHO2_12_FULL_35_23]|nr:MAG: ferrous iron transport protein B [Gammaproteobacteria bacterium RIFCSPHIGHO2_12_FULL_35_23]
MSLTRIALIGNPNSGKSTLFNALTGSNQKVGNWPGVTVEKKIGRFIYQSTQLEVVDLPGTYNLSALPENNSLDEQIAIDYIISHDANIIINVVDATNLERNLFLTTQLFELGVPMILAINMTDLAKRKGIMINYAALSAKLKCPVIPIVANKQLGLEQLKLTVLRHAKISHFSANKIQYPDQLEQAIARLQPKFEAISPKNQARYLAIHLLDNDVYAKRQAPKALQQQANELKNILEQTFNKTIDILIADARYAFINQLISHTVSNQSTTRHSITNLIDNILLNRFLGIPIFLCVMYAMFLFAINVGGAFQDFFDIASNTIFVQGLEHLLLNLHFPNWLIAILSAGIGKGINTTITFIPVIGGMFLFLSFLEGSGYMTRAAFVVDRLMQAIGLPGKSFVPMIVGFGCNVPSIMAARTLENKRDRILTILMSPFMSCGARLAIFAVFTAAFFPKGGQNVVFALYLIGIFVAILTGFILRKTLLRGHPAPLIMEMPAYHLPNLKNLLRQTWQRLKNFLYKAGRFIIPICVLIGTLNAFTVEGKLTTVSNEQNSVLSLVAKDITPIFAPMGISQNNWPATVGLLTGTLAKEVVVGTLNTLYSQTGHLAVSEQSNFGFWRGIQAAFLSIPTNITSLGSSLGNPVLAGAPTHDVNQGVLGVMYVAFGGQAAAFAYLLFVLLYVPCVSAMAVMLRELNRNWTIFSICWTTGLAYGAATFFYQIVTFKVHPLYSSCWLIGIVASFLITLFTMRSIANHHQHKARPLRINTINSVSP